MYHRLVRRLAVANFERINTHDYDALLKGCAADITHRFGGDHALGGTRCDRDAFRLWLERLGRLVPDMQLTVEDVWVKGLPHNTVAILRWTNKASRPNGEPYQNHGVHVVRLRWGKAVAIDANEDSQAVVDLLAELAASGVEEASAAPITSS